MNQTLVVVLKKEKLLNNFHCYTNELSYFICKGEIAFFIKNNHQLNGNQQLTLLALRLSFGLRFVSQP